jgi:hypothetical protein
MMKLQKFGAATAILCAAAFLGCSADNSPSTSEKDASISFKLTADNDVQIDSIEFDLNTQAGGDVTAGSIQVEDQDPSNLPLLGIQSLGAGSYYLLLTASGTRTTDGQAVTCTSATATEPLGTLFPLAAGEVDHYIGNILLRCSVTTQVDNTGSAIADVSVVVDEFIVGGVVETFTYGPRNVKGHVEGTECVYQPVNIKISGAHTGITYTWAAPAPDGSFVWDDASSTEGDFICASSGTKTLSVTGTSGGQSTTKTFTVVCDGAPCSFVCGNNIQEGSEECDEATPRCDQTTCTVTPVCGDGVTDTGECEPPGTATCSATCVPTGPFCGDGFITGTEQCEPPNTLVCSSTCQNIVGCGNGVLEGSEQCDNGTANSNTTPGACRTNCTNPSCGDGVVDPTETCEPPGTASCSATCQSVSARHVACVACITANPDLGSFQTEACDVNAACVALENCVVDKDCFSPVAGACWCGTTDIDSCLLPAFPFPPTSNSLNCVPEYSAAYNNPTSNADAIDRMFVDTTTASGYLYPGYPAMGILNAMASGAAAECTDECL